MEIVTCLTKLKDTILNELMDSIDPIAMSFSDVNDIMHNLYNTAGYQTCLSKIKVMCDTIDDSDYVTLVLNTSIDAAVRELMIMHYYVVAADEQTFKCICNMLDDKLRKIIINDIKYACSICKNHDRRTCRTLKMLTTLQYNKKLLSQCISYFGTSSESMFRDVIQLTTKKCMVLLKSCFKHFE